ncbi:MAG: DUF1176 domain-containing protein, partial [Pseudomonadota bacterium]
MRLFSGTGLLLSMTFAVCTPQTALSQSVSEAARDWWVSCNEKLYCIADVSGTSDNDPEMQLKLERSNKPDNKIFVTVQTGIKLGEGMRVDISVLGLDFEVGGEIRKVYAGNEMAFVESIDSTLLANLRSGTKGQVTVRYGGNTGTIVYDVSLSGVTTALLIMDEAQGRLDRVDAAVARGGEPSASPSAPRSAEASPGTIADNSSNDGSNEGGSALETPESENSNPPISDFLSEI